MIMKVILAAVLATSFGTIATPATAATIVRIAPPPPRAEAAAEARPGYVWVAGHWGWRNNRHQWVKGTYIRERRGYHYTQPTWVERNGRWHTEGGQWRRGDRDGDGVPNNQDRAPDNPNRR